MTFLLSPANGPECPHCGCRDSRILAKPDSKLWFGRFGRARCGFCRQVFSFRELPEEDGPIEIEVDEDEDPPAIAEEPPTPTAAPTCPDCGSEMRVSSTRKTYRWYKCAACRQTLKVAR